MKITKEQFQILEGIYKTSHSCKDPEALKLAKDIFKVNFNEFFDSYKIDYGYILYPEFGWYADYANEADSLVMSDPRKLNSLPIIVIMYLITKNNKYLKGSKYVKKETTVNKEKREFIKFSNCCYFIDSLYAVDSEIVVEK